MEKILIDFEFSGMNDEYVSYNEIIWLTYYNINTWEKKHFSFNYLEEDKEEQEMFCPSFFRKNFCIPNTIFYWFWTDKEKLDTFWININIIDIQNEPIKK